MTRRERVHGAVLGLTLALVVVGLALLDSCMRSR